MTRRTRSSVALEAAIHLIGVGIRTPNPGPLYHNVVCYLYVQGRVAPWEAPDFDGLAYGREHRGALRRARHDACKG